MLLILFYYFPRPMSSLCIHTCVMTMKSNNNSNAITPTVPANSQCGQHVRCGDAVLRGVRRVLGRLNVARHSLLLLLSQSGGDGGLQRPSHVPAGDVWQFEAVRENHKTEFSNLSRSHYLCLRNSQDAHCSCRRAMSVVKLSSGRPVELTKNLPSSAASSCREPGRTCSKYACSFCGDKKSTVSSTLIPGAGAGPFLSLSNNSPGPPLCSVPLGMQLPWGLA